MVIQCVSYPSNITLLSNIMTSCHSSLCWMIMLGQCTIMQGREQGWTGTKKWLWTFFTISAVVPGGWGLRRGLRLGQEIQPDGQGWYVHGRALTARPPLAGSILGRPIKHHFSCHAPIFITKLTFEFYIALYFNFRHILVPNL